MPFSRFVPDSHKKVEKCRYSFWLLGLNLLFELNLMFLCMLLLLFFLPGNVHLHQKLWSAVLHEIIWNFQWFAICRSNVTLLNVYGKSTQGVQECFISRCSGESYSWVLEFDCRGIIFLAFIFPKSIFCRNNIWSRWIKEGFFRIFAFLTLAPITLCGFIVKDVYSVRVITRSIQKGLNAQISNRGWKSYNEIDSERFDCTNCQQRLKGL